MERTTYYTIVITNTRCRKDTVMLMIHLSHNNNIPLYQQIYEFIRDEIRNGKLACSEKLPSSRKLATYLQVSRNTVDMAYGQLLSEGYIESRPKSGYFVSKISELSNHSSQSNMSMMKTKTTKTHYMYDFSPFLIDISKFPFSTWRKLSRECMNYDNHDLFLLGNRQGDLSFRQAINKYIHDSRGVNCSEDQILVGAGVDYLLQLLCQILPSSSKIAMENPTYRQAYTIFTGMHMDIQPISLTKSGINIDELKESNASICYVTPSHQYPVGTVMSYSTRLSLLNWANQSSSRYIIEDDHDSEFRYQGKPIPSLAAMDTNDKVIYLGTFSRSIAPAIRIGYIVLPKPLLNHYKQHCSYYASTVSRVDQAILTSFINGGYFERHLNRMRKIYKSKHDVLIHELKQFGNELSIHTENAGLHVLVQFHLPFSEAEIIEIAKQHNIAIYPLSAHYIAQCEFENGTFILLGFGNLEESEIINGVKALYDALHESC